MRILWTVPALFLLACGGGDGGGGGDTGSGGNNQPPAPVCGDNICTVGDCCQDCGCNMGSSCMPNGVCQSVGTSSLTFNLTDECASVSDNIQVRLFDNTDRAVWPAVGMVYLLPPGGQETTFPLACTLGATICYGADDVAAGLPRRNAHPRKAHAATGLKMPHRLGPLHVLSFGAG